MADGSHCDAGPISHEFNLWFDPHAAKKVLRTAPYITSAWKRIAALPADVASQPMWGAELQQAVRAITGSAAAKYIAEYLFPSVNVQYPTTYYLLLTTYY